MHTIPYQLTPIVWSGRKGAQWWTILNKSRAIYDKIKVNDCLGCYEWGTYRCATLVRKNSNCVWHVPNKEHHRWTPWLLSETKRIQCDAINSKWQSLFRRFSTHTFWSLLFLATCSPFFQMTLVKPNCMFSLQQQEPFFALNSFWPVFSSTTRPMKAKRPPLQPCGRAWSIGLPVARFIYPNPPWLCFIIIVFFCQFPLLPCFVVNFC